MHVHAIASPRTDATPAADLLRPLTPAAYVQLRRIAAGYTVAALARALIIIGDHRRPIDAPGRTLDEGRAEFRRVRDIVLLLERPGVTTVDATLLRSLASLFPFDPAVYRQLAVEPRDRHPRVCRSCGCSGHDACVDQHDHVCSWFTPALCSHCATAAIDGAVAA